MSQQSLFLLLEVFLQKPVGSVGIYVCGIYVFCQIVHKKTASVLCLTTMKNEDKMDFSKILEAIKVRR